jgi:hypothetical protein
VPGHPGKVVKVDKATQGLYEPGSIWERHLRQETADLTDLSRRGYPTVEHEIVEWTDAAGNKRAGLLMQRLDGVNSRDLRARFGELDDELEDAILEGRLGPELASALPPEFSGVTQKTVDELKGIRALAERDGLAVEDFQVMISGKDGSVTIIDSSMEPIQWNAGADDRDEFFAVLDRLIEITQAVMHIKKAVGTP